MTASRTLGRPLLALLAMAACLVVVPDRAQAAPEEKVTICHRTNSRTNPYNQQAVAESSAVEGHRSHTGPVFSEDVEAWGDIIPPITPGLPNGLNWDAEGRAVLDNGCEVPPDVGPLPAAAIGDAECAGTTPTVQVTVSNAPDATDPATFTVRVDGTVVQTVGPVAPGDSETVTLTGAPEDTTAVVEVVSGGQVVASTVVTADCAPGPPDVAVQAALGCADETAEARIEVTDNGPAPVEVQLLVEGEQVGPTVTVAPGTTGARDIDVSAYEGRTVTAQLVVDGEAVATWTVTPGCVPPAPEPSARVAGTVCPPPSATVTLANSGDPDSAVVFGIRVDGSPVQTSAPIYGGDTTTIVVDLSPFEDQTVRVRAGYNGTVVIDRTVTVDCVADDDDGGGTGPSNGGTAPGGDAVLPVVGAGFPAGVVAVGVGLVAAGAALLLAGARVRR